MGSQNPSIKALVKLIDDPDEDIFHHVRDELIKCGSKAIPYLEKSWEDDYYGLVFQSRIENIIHDIQFEEVKIALKNCCLKATQFRFDLISFSLSLVSDKLSTSLSALN